VTESAGLPIAAYAVAAWLAGRDAGLLAGLAAIWGTAAVRKIATGSVPSLLAISAIVLTLQTAVAIATGRLWIFLLQFPVANLCMCVLCRRATTSAVAGQRSGSRRGRSGRRRHTRVGGLINEYRLVA